MATSPFLNQPNFHHLGTTSRKCVSLNKYFRVIIYEIVHSALSCAMDSALLQEAKFTIQQSVSEYNTNKNMTFGSHIAYQMSSPSSILIPSSICFLTSSAELGTENLN